MARAFKFGDRRRLPRHIGIISPKKNLTMVLRFPKRTIQILFMKILLNKFAPLRPGRLNEFAEVDYQYSANGL